MSHLLIYLPLLWFAARLSRHPGNRALRAVVACLALSLVDAPDVMPTVQALTGLPQEGAILIQNLALSAACLMLMLFFVFAAGGAGMGRRAWSESAVWAGVAGVMAMCVLLTPAAFAPPPPLEQAPRVATVVMFFALGNAYYGYAGGLAALWAWRYAGESPRRARPGFWIASVGLGAFAVSSVLRALTSLPVPWQSPVGDVVNPAIGAAMALFVLGVSWAGLAGRVTALRVWWHHRHAHEELRTLWLELHALYPASALDPPHSRWLDRLALWHVHRRYWRRVIEIRDGLVDISVHLRDLGFRPQHPAHEQASQVREALHRQRVGHAPSTSLALPVAVPENDTELTDVYQLIQLSRALRSTPA